MNQNLRNSVHKWKRALTDAATGPLRIASEIVAIAANWDEYKSDAGGLTVSAFLRRELGRGRDLAFFKRRAEAVEKLGDRTVVNWLHHEVAVWIVNNFQEDSKRIRAAFIVAQETKRHNGNPLNLAQAKPILMKAFAIKTQKQPRTCANCIRLEEVNRELRELLASYGIDSAIGQQ